MAQTQFLTQMKRVRTDPLTAELINDVELNVKIINTNNTPPSHSYKKQSISYLKIIRCKAFDQPRYNMKLFYLCAATATANRMDGPHLCGSCESDADCGPNSMWMKCSSQKCICDNNWADANKDMMDGCEKFSNGAVMNIEECPDPSPTEGPDPTGDGPKPTGDGPKPTGDGPDPTGDGPDPTGDYPEKDGRCCQMFRVGYSRDSDYSHVQYQCKYTQMDEYGYMKYACNGHPRLGEDSDLPPMYVNTFKNSAFAHSRMFLTILTIY